MKRITKYFQLTIIFALLLSSCSDYLQPEPKSFFTPTNVYNDEAGLQALVITMKKDLKNENTGWHNPFSMEYTLSDLAISIDPSDLRDVTPNNSPTFPYLDFFDNVYGYIKNTNILLSRIDEVEGLEEQSKNRLIAEAYWYRAYWYYRLVHTYGDVPWIGEEIIGPKLDFQTYSRNAILEKIQSDLEYAKEWVPNAISRNSDITKAAVDHLLTKIYLAQSKFDEAITAATSVIEGPHALMRERFGIDAGDPNRNIIWDLHRGLNKNGAQNTEVIYATIDRLDAPVDARSGGTYLQRNYTPSWWKVLDNVGNRWCNWSTPTGDTLGIGNADVRTNNFFNYGIWNEGAYSWENTPDQRRSDINWIEMQEIIGCNEGPQDGEHFTMQNYSSLVDTFDTWYSWPRYKVFSLSPNSRTPVGGEADQYVFRLAETYLLRAEAYYWNGQLGLAAQDINEVRERAMAPLVSASDVTIDYIFDERARELYTETPRHSEMTRVSYIMANLGRDGYSTNNFSSNNWYYDRVMEFNDHYEVTAPIWRGDVSHIDPRNVLMPIPQSVIEANTQGRVNQNQGYVGAENNEPPIESIE